MFTRTISMTAQDVARWLADQPESEQTRMVATALAEMERQRRIIQAVFDFGVFDETLPTTTPAVESGGSILPKKRHAGGRKPNEKSLAGTVREALKEFGPMTLDDIATLCGRTRIQARSLLTHMLKTKKVVQMKGGIFALAN